MPRLHRAVDGVLLLDKPTGLSSNAALQRAKWLFDASKAGHTGNLDPLATGLLPICFGEATKFSQFLIDADKTYEALIELGVRTDTGDAEGVILERREVAVTDIQIEAALASFRGAIQQVPPMFSALKHRGRPLYEYARKGEEIARAPRTVFIHDLELMYRQEDTLALSVSCSKGTYIRTLAEDLGLVLGCGAHLAALRRTQVGAFRIMEAVSLTALGQLEAAERERRLLPVDCLVSSLPAVSLDAHSAGYLRCGQGVWQAHLQVGTKYRIYNEKQQFMGVGEVDARGCLVPRRLMAEGSVTDWTLNASHEKRL